ncbi:MAG TPA: hypothetical protein VMW27_14975 [Thermoanaerobaculia bacterium]|nr:hypothetical protein [Thermoanaerobaculia bacterium]
MRNRSVPAVLVVSLLLGLSPLAADPLIQRGTDVFTTPADGRTFYDFAQSPIPVGFFCKGSAPFAGRVAFKGLPLATGTPGQLWGSDTVVERLDDAIFDATGIASTRLQFRALSLVSIAPVKTSCGSFHVYVSLAGTQRVTTMNIFRTQSGGGTFEAPLAVDARITFIPVTAPRGKVARKLEVTGSFTFPVTPIPWSFTAGEQAKSRRGPVSVDTDGDLKADTLLPSNSNFMPGIPPERVMEKSCECYLECHESQGEEHCYYTTREFCMFPC